MVTYADIKASEEIKTYIIAADRTLAAIGYTEHNFPHVKRAAKVAGDILKSLGHDDREVELARIAGYMHDIGNVVNRVDHSQSGAIMAYRILDKMGMDADEICTVISAIGNHDEGSGMPVNGVAAALILADKTDVRRSRVRSDTDERDFDIHDRVNYSVLDSHLVINARGGRIVLELMLEDRYSSVMEYFEIFHERMVLCRKAAESLGVRFELEINGQSVM